ncbi:MAG: DMT family transporter [Desulfobacterales bacterium]
MKRLKFIYDSPYLLLTLTVLFWSGNFIVGRAVRGDVPPVALAFWRWTVAFVIVAVQAIPHLRRDKTALVMNWRILLLLAAIGVAAFNTLVYTGLQWTIAINAFLLQAMMPVLIAVLSFLMFGDKATPLQKVSLPICLTGALTIILKGDPRVLGALSLNPGDVLVLLAVICYAGYSVLLKIRPPVHPLSFVAVTFLGGALLILPFYIWESIFVRRMTFDGPTLLAVAYVGIFPSVVSYMCFNRGVELIGANRAGLFLYLMPVFGSLMAIGFLGEAFEWFHGVGIALIALGIFLAVRKG